MNAIVPGGGSLYLTKWGKASSLQKDRETKRTPAGVAGGRLVISWRSCSASSSVGLQKGSHFQHLVSVHTTWLHRD